MVFLVCLRQEELFMKNGCIPLGGVQPFPYIMKKNKFQISYPN